MAHRYWGSFWFIPSGIYSGVYCEPKDLTQVLSPNNECRVFPSALLTLGLYHSLLWGTVLDTMGVLSIIPDLYPLDTSSTPTPVSDDNQKYLQTSPRVS